MPFRAIVSGPVVMVVLPRRGPRCKKLPEFVGVSRSGEADKQANNCAGKVCPMELENWVQTSHSKPGSATGSHPIQREGGWTGGRGHIGDRASQLGGPVDWLEGPVDWLEGPVEFLIIFCTIQFSRRWMRR